MQYLLSILFGIVTAFVIALVFALPVMWLWNWLIPEIFGLVEIGFWQSFGLLILSSLLFKSNSTSSNS